MIQNTKCKKNRKKENKINTNNFQQIRFCCSDFEITWCYFEAFAFRHPCNSFFIQKLTKKQEKILFSVNVFFGNIFFFFQLLLTYLFTRSFVHQFFTNARKYFDFFFFFGSKWFRDVLGKIIRKKCIFIFNNVTKVINIHIFFLSLLSVMILFFQRLNRFNNI